MLESEGQFSAKDLDAAYRHLGIDPAHASVLADEHIVSQYRSRLLDVSANEQAQMKESLRMLGDARQSEMIKQSLSDCELPRRTSAEHADIFTALETYAQALAWLNADEMTVDDFIASLATVKVAENEQDAQLARKAVEIIQQARNSSGLRAYLDSGQLPADLDVPSAYRLLGIEVPQNNSGFLEDDAIYSQYTVVASDNPTRRAEYRNALSVIAHARDSAALMSAIRDETAESNQQSQLIPLSEPRGLRNIGNTCYLSSLLQYFYTVKPIHRLLDNLDEQKELGTSPKKVGGTRIKQKQVQKAQDCKLYIIAPWK